MKSYTVKRLTRQYNGHGHYKWLIQCGVCDELQNRQDLSAWREWCWQIWGASRELKWAITSRPVPIWAWDSEHGNRRIYLKSDAELVLFELKF